MVHRAINGYIGNVVTHKVHGAGYVPVLAFGGEQRGTAKDIFVHNVDLQVGQHKVTALDIGVQPGISRVVSVQLHVLVVMVGAVYADELVAAVQAFDGIVLFDVIKLVPAVRGLAGSGQRIGCGKAAWRTVIAIEREGKVTAHVRCCVALGSAAVNQRIGNQAAKRAVVANAAQRACAAVSAAQRMRQVGNYLFGQRIVGWLGGFGGLCCRNRRGHHVRFTA